MEVRTGHKWRFDIDSPMTPNSNSSEVTKVPEPTGPFPDDYGPDYNLEWDPFPTLPETTALPALKIIYWKVGSGIETRQLRCRCKRAMNRLT